MSALSDLLDGINPDLEPSPTPVAVLFTPALRRIELYATSRLECWTLENFLLFSGDLNSEETTVERIQWGRGFYGLSIKECQNAEWCVRWRDKVGRGDTPETALDAVFEGEHA